MMVKNKSAVASVPILVLLSIILSSCSKTSETEITKTNNINQTPTLSNNVVSANNVVSVNNNAAVNSLNVPTPIVNDTPASIANSAPTVNKKSVSTVNEPKSQIGTGGGDLSLFTQVRAALSSDKELMHAVVVEIKAGNAVLTGNVSSEAQKTKAAQLVQSVKGIKSVKNILRVSS